jgi:transcription elongation factor GreA-like protein/transcription elongation GreA/GreB family factor
MTYIKEFRKRSEYNDYPGFLKLWEEYCYSEELDELEFKKILEEAKASPIGTSFGKHVEKGLLLWKLMKDTPLQREVLKLIFDIQTTNSEQLAEIAYNTLKAKYGTDPLFEEKIKLVGLAEKENFQGVIRGYELLSHLTKGNYVFHTAGWGTGEVVDVSLIREEVSFEFEYVIGEKTFSFQNILKTLIPLKNDHFFSLRFGNPDQLEKEAKKDPLKIIILLLKDLGPKTAAEIKEELCELVIPEKEWSRWWQTARAKIKKDTKIFSPSSLKKPFRLLEEEISHEENLYKALENKPNINQTIQLVYSFIKDFPKRLKNVEISNSLKTKLDEVLSATDLSDSQRLQILFFLETLGAEKEKVKEMVKNISSVPEILDEIEIMAFKKRVLSISRQERNDWKEIFFTLFFSVQQNFLRDYILTELSRIAPKQLLKDKIKELLDQPLTYPQVFVWYFQKIIKPKCELPFSDKEGELQFFEGFLTLLDHLSQKLEYRDLAKKMIGILLSNRYKLVRDMFQKATIEQIKEFLLLSSKCHILNNHDIKIIHSLATVIYPSLITLEEENENKEELSVIWTTEDGYKKTQEKIKHIATVETIQNAKEIEEARSHGDLRENAEFKAALEKRARLQGELTLLSDQFNKAQIILENDVKTDKVGIGTIVKCKNEKQDEKTFTLLGPWDADTEKNIISFQSKLAQQMKDKKVGDSFDFQGEKHTICEISSFFN